MEVYEMNYKLIKRLIQVWFRWQFSILNKVGGRRLLLQSMAAVCASYEKCTNEYCFYDLLPKVSGEYTSIGIQNSKLPKYAVILQGPIMVKDHFTLETVRLYKKTFPLASIIVSTWLGENEKEIHEIERAGATVVQSAIPNESGVFNINYQCISSSVGIKTSIQLGCEYILKTRTDTRLYRNNIFEMMYTLIKEHPITIDNCQERIVVLGGNRGKLFQSYNFCDFVTFGNANDLLEFYDIPIDRRFKNRVDSERKHRSDMTRKQEAEQMMNPEIMLIESYLQRKGNELNFSIGECWKNVCKYFISISPRDICLYWMDKYDLRFRNNYGAYVFWKSDKEELALSYDWDYFTWMNIFCGSVEYSGDYENFQLQELKNFDEK